MKMKKILATILASAAVICATSGNVLAHDRVDGETINSITEYSLLRYAHISTLKPSITSTGTIKAIISLYENLGYSLTLELQEYDGTWDSIDSWSLDGTGNGTISETCSLESGKKYRAKATVEVYDGSGRVVESTTKYSASVTAR